MKTLMTRMAVAICLTAGFSLTLQAQVVCPTKAVMADGVFVCYETVQLQQTGPACTCALTPECYHYISGSTIVNTGCSNPPQNCDCHNCPAPSGKGGGGAGNGTTYLDFNPNNAAQAWFADPHGSDIWVLTSQNEIMRCYKFQTREGPVRFAYRSTISNPSQLPSWITMSTFPASKVGDYIEVEETPGNVVKYFWKLGVDNNQSTPPKTPQTPPPVQTTPAPKSTSASGTG